MRPTDCGYTRGLTRSIIQQLFDPFRWPENYKSTWREPSQGRGCGARGTSSGGRDSIGDRLCLTLRDEGCG